MSKLLFSLDIKTAKRLSLLAKKKEIRRVCHGIYTDNLTESLEKIVKSHWMEILPHIVSKGILSFRTAIDLKPIPYQEGMGIVFITSSYTKTIKIPGLVIKIYKGNPNVYYEQVLPRLARSNIPRMLLENLTIIKDPVLKGLKTIGEAGVEKQLVRELQFYGEKRLNEIREEAKQISVDLGYGNEYNKLSQIISALLSTQDAAYLITPHAKSLAKKQPYDEQRLQLFENLNLYLKKCLFKKRTYHFTNTSFKNLSFFESYFSNFIEGTEFIIDEAEDIIFKGIEINQRHADSHDILANFHLTNDYSENNGAINRKRRVIIQDSRPSSHHWLKGYMEGYKRLQI